MSGRRADAALIALHGLPSLLGTVWFQTVGVEGLPGGRWPWLVLLYAVPPVVAVGFALDRRTGRLASLGFGTVLAVLAVAWTWHPPTTSDHEAVARMLTTLGVAVGASIVGLAQRGIAHAHADEVSETSLESRARLLPDEETHG